MLDGDLISVIRTIHSPKTKQPDKMAHRRIINTCVEFENVRKGRYFFIG